MFSMPAPFNIVLRMNVIQSYRILSIIKKLAKYGSRQGSRFSAGIVVTGNSREEAPLYVNCALCATLPLHRYISVSLPLSYSESYKGGR